MYGPEILDLGDLATFFFRGHCRIMGTRWLLARPFSAISLYLWFQLVFAWRHRHYVIAGGGVISRQPYIRGSNVSSLMSRKLLRSRWQSHPPQRRIPYCGGCSRHVINSTFNRAAGTSATALRPSFQLLSLWRTENHVFADDSCAFLLQVCCTLGNSYDMLGCEWDPCVYNSESHQTGRRRLRNCNYTSNV
jgi:hypothetical protein